SMTMLPDGSARYVTLGPKVDSDNTNLLAVRPPAGPGGLAAAFPAQIGQASSSSILKLSPPDAAGNQLAVRTASPHGVAYLAPGADPAAAVFEPLVNQITQIAIAPSGEAAAIVSGSGAPSGPAAAVSFRPAGPSGRFDTPRMLDLAGNGRSYGVGIVIDPDGGVLAVYRTEQSAALLQTYAPPGGAFGPAQALPVSAGAIDTAVVRSSTNGHAILTWTEDTGGDTNAEEVWSMSRAPGQPLGDRSLVARADAGHSVSSAHGAVTDDGTRYVAYLDGVMATPCTNNYGRDVGAVLAVNSGAAWTKLNAPTAWPQRTEINTIATAGNRVAVVSFHSDDPSGDRCAGAHTTSRLDIQTGTGAALGTARTLTSESVTDRSASVREAGLGLNAAGAWALLDDEPNGGGSARFLYTQAADAPPPPQPTDGAVPPGAVRKPLPAPGTVTISGNRLVASGAGQVPFSASCVRSNAHGGRTFCAIRAIIQLQVSGKNPGGNIAHAVKPKKTTKKPTKPKVKLITLGTSKVARVANGKRGRIVVRLNAQGTKRLRAMGRRPLTVTLRVTIARKGFATRTITRRVKLVAAPAKRAAGGGNRAGTR
ncbi:MAG TPA: hypothetical protein PKE32_10175, partial [Miltoncostaeaceae bacterium]|nr:hypothetical protein [Miltoncostaeaceae bacterium]